jgi:hypothetical protein
MGAIVIEYPATIACGTCDLSPCAHPKIRDRSPEQSCADWTNPAARALYEGLATMAPATLTKEDILEFYEYV